MARAGVSPSSNQSSSSSFICAMSDSAASRAVAAPDRRSFTHSANVTPPAASEVVMPYTLQNDSKVSRCPRGCKCRRCGQARRITGFTDDPRMRAEAPSRHRKAVPSLMDFSRVELSEEDRQFQGELRAFLKTLVTTKSSPVIVRPVRTSTKACTWRLARPVIWLPISRMKPTAVSVGYATHLEPRDRSSAHAVVPLGHDGDGRAGGRAVRLARAQG